MAMPGSDSEGDISDPSFKPIISPPLSSATIPRQGSSIHAQQRAERNRPHRQIRSSPPQGSGKASASDPSLRPRPKQQSSPPPAIQPTEFLDLPILPKSKRQDKTKTKSKSKSRSSPIRPSSTSPQPPPPPAQIPIRPNTYLGPPSTWRSWTAQERTIAASLERTRFQDLAIHLYNAHILHMKAEIAGLGRKRSRSRSRTKANGKQRAGSSPPPSPEKQEVLVFDPPRVWTAWPLPPDQVPREELLPVMALGGGGYRREREGRVSAELEECLIAVAARFAKERWEAREWDDVEGEREISGGKGMKRRKRDYDDENGSRADLKKGTGSEVSMQDSGEDSERAKRDDEDANSSSEESDSLAIPLPGNHDNDIPMFSSQAFAAPSLSISTSSSQDESTEHFERPVFMADDDRIRQLLLPSTRHVISQLDKLLDGLHKMTAYRRQKVVDIGGRGHDQVLGMADLFFSSEVVDRARKRCDRLFDLQS